MIAALQMHFSTIEMGELIDMEIDSIGLASGQIRILAPPRKNLWIAFKKASVAF